MPRETIPLEQDLEQLETQLREVNANQEQLNKNFLELTEVNFPYSNGPSQDCYALIKLPGTISCLTREPSYHVQSIPKGYRGFPTISFGHWLTHIGLQ